MPVPVAAPYDSLATVTSQVRTILGDYIQGLPSTAQGNVNTAGTVVSWVSGTKFSFYFAGASIQINGIAYTVLSLNSATSMNLVTSAGVLTNVAYSVTIPTGDIFQDSQGYVLQIVNLAWRKLQKKLAVKGHPRLQNEVIISSIPAVTNLDPSSQQWISWTQFFDGTNLLSPTTTPAGPVLPQDFISPREFHERVHGQFAEFNERPPSPNSLPSRIKGSANFAWDWREDAIYVPGSLLVMDWHLRYSAYLPEIAVQGSGFSTTQVPIMRCAEALAYYAAEIFVTPRGGPLGPQWEAKGDVAVEEITGSWVKIQQRMSISRQPWGRRRRGQAVIGLGN